MLELAPTPIKCASAILSSRSKPRVVGGSRNDFADLAAIALALVPANVGACSRGTGRLNMVYCQRNGWGQRARVYLRTRSQAGPWWVVRFVSIPNDTQGAQAAMLDKLWFWTVGGVIDENP